MTFKFTPKQTGLGAMLKQAQALKKSSKEDSLAKPMQWAKAEECPERIRILFDNSSSMYGQMLTDAIEGCTEFLRNCTPNQTAVALHPLHQKTKDLTTLNSNLPAMSVYLKAIQSQGATPLFETLWSAQNLEPRATRYVVFSDGQPDNQHREANCIELAKAQGTPIDTVLILEGSYVGALEILKEYKILKNLADKTGGIFMVFDRNKMNFRTGFKYLAPKNRLALTDGTFRAALEQGKVE